MAPGETTSTPPPAAVAGVHRGSALPPTPGADVSAKILNDGKTPARVGTSVERSSDVRGPEGAEGAEGAEETFHTPATEPERASRPPDPRARRPPSARARTSCPLGRPRTSRSSGTCSAYRRRRTRGRVKGRFESSRVVVRVHQGILTKFLKPIRGVSTSARVVHIHPLGAQQRTRFPGSSSIHHVLG